MKKSGLDRTDFQIIEALQKNARLSNKELASAVELAQSSCLQRVQNLTRTGVIKGFHSEIEASALGIGLQAMVAVQLKRTEKQKLESLYEHLFKLKEVISVYYVSGRYDILVHLVARDSDHLRDLITDQFGTRNEIGRHETSLIYDLIRNKTLPNLNRS